MGDPIPDARLAEIARVHACVDRFPFTSDRYGVRDVDGDMITDSYGLFWTEELAEFVALSSTAVPELLAEVRRLRAVAVAAERERDDAQKRFEDEQYAHAMGCPGCCNLGGTHPHSERAIDEREEREAGWIFDPTRDCPQGCSVAVADTGEYEWMCGCDLVPCEVEGCVHGAHLTERNALRRERDEARESSEAWRTRFRGVAGALRAFLASQPQTEKVRETIEALERDLGWKEVRRG